MYAIRSYYEFSHLVPEFPLIRNVTTVIGTHVGVNGLGFVAVTAE